MPHGVLRLQAQVIAKCLTALAVRATAKAMSDPLHLNITKHPSLALLLSPCVSAVLAPVFEFGGSGCYLMNGLPGVKITARNAMNTFVTEEIDVACLNENHPRGLGNITEFFLVECKGWNHPVNSEHVAWVLTKIRRRGVSFGILIAADGITGEPEHLRRAHALVFAELSIHKIRMVIVTRNEIEGLTCGEEFAKLVLVKVCTLIPTGGRCY